METALYFPYATVPENSWFTQVLLYWDGAASLEYGPWQALKWPFGPKMGSWFSPYMDELVKTGLLRSIRPIELLQKGNALDRLFLAMLDEKQSRGRNDRAITFIQPESIGTDLREGLLDRGLASWYKEDRDKLWMRADIYEDIMAYIAGSLCRVDPTLFAVTDKSSSLAALLPPEDDTPHRLQALRQAIITEALPVPSRPVPVREIASFKEGHRDQLRRLQRYLNKQLVDIAPIEDDYVRKVKIDSVLQEITDEVAVLREQMSKRNWPRLVLAGVAGVVASALTVGAGIATGGSALAIGMGIGGGAVSLGPAAYQVVDLVRPSRLDGREPLAYAAMAQAI